MASMSARDFLFFDPDKASGPSATPDVGKDVTARFAPGQEAQPLTVSALLARVKNALAGSLEPRLTVVGELSNVKHHASGHLYFRLKDGRCAIDACMFRMAAKRLKFRPADGLEVVVEGRVDVYEVRGQLQLYAETMTPRGAGALELAFRQLRDKLQAEGLFDPAAKKHIPRYPRAVGVITSATGAAVRDICRTLRRRWSGAEIYLYPAAVQGDTAAAGVARGIELMDAAAERLGIDTIIVGRGGGSLEDLWAFNEEVLARAVFAARTPIISGVGHETDVTICDMVADLRAPTPTGAAELAVPDATEVRRHLIANAARLERCVRGQLDRGRGHLAGLLRSGVFRDPLGRIRTQQQRIDELTHRLRAAARHRLTQGHHRLEPAARKLAALHPARLAERARARLDRIASRLAWVLGGRSKRGSDRLGHLEARLAAVHPVHRLRLAQQSLRAAERQLESMSHRSVLARGFSVTRGAGGRILRSTAEVSPGQVITTELADGNIRSTVEGRRQRSPGRKGEPDNQKSLFDTD
jgi:exodeoxyribonuclease VII large subunit